MVSMNCFQRILLTAVLLSCMASWAAPIARAGTPVCITPNEKLDPETSYGLKTPAGPIVAAQLDAEGKLWAWVDQPDPGELAVVKGHKVPENFGVVVRQARDGQVDVTIDGELFTVFVQEQPKPFLYPVIGPTGDPVTRSYPMAKREDERHDHPHHRSIWSAWGDVRTSDYENWGTNYWHQSSTPEHQDRQIIKRVIKSVSGPVFGQLAVEIEWTARDGQREFTEYRLYTFFRGDKDTRIIDVRNHFAFNDGDVMFYDTKEAGILSLRIATSMDEKPHGHATEHGTMTNANGQKGHGQCWGQPAAWCDYVGPVNGKTVGIAVFDAPCNLQHPPRWHIRDYGLYAVNPFGVKDFPNGKGKNGSHIFKKGTDATFTYRILIHTGDTQTAGVAGQFEQYARHVAPPAVTEMP